MELYKKLIVNLFLIASIFASISHESLIDNISIIDFCKLDKAESQFNLGYQSSDFIDNYYFSIDKLISYNLVASSKISLLRYNNFEFYNQNTFLFSLEDDLLDLIISINYLTDDLKMKRWFNFGFIFELFKNHHLFDDNFFIGLYYDIDNKDLFNLNHYIRIHKEFHNHMSISLSSKYTVLHLSPLSFLSIIDASKLFSKSFLARSSQALILTYFSK